MKRLVIAWLAIFSLATAGLAYAETPGSVQPPCADITGGGFTLMGGIVRGSIDTLEPSCTTTTYTLHISYTNPGGRMFTKSQSVQGDGSSSVILFSIRVPGGVKSVDTFVTSTDASGAVLDRGPDEGTIPVADGAGGGTGYN